MNNFWDTQRFRNLFSYQLWYVDFWQISIFSKYVIVYGKGGIELELRHTAEVFLVTPLPRPTYK